jgi:hypothetical protein
MTRATQIAIVDHRTVVHLSLQAACIASLLFAADGHDTRRAAPPDPAVLAQASPNDAAVATVAMRLDVGVVPLGIAVVERGDVTRVIAGPLRAELTADGVALADDRFGDRIVAAVRAAPAGAAWLFLAADGTVARARSFLGPLEPLGHVPQPENGMVGSPTASQGRLAIRTRDPDASLWTTDGSAPVAPAQDLPPGIVVSAAFVDADHGMIVIEGGALFLTRDGMRSFVRVGLGGAAAASVVGREGALYVTTSSGVAIFDRGGALREGPGAAAAVPPLPDPVWLPVSDRDAALYRRVFTAALHRYGALVAEAFYGTIAADGRPVVAVDPPHSKGVNMLVALDGPPPDVDLTALEHYRRCVVRRWGDHLGLACGDGLFRADATTLRPTLVTAKSVLLDVALSGDGVHAAWSCGTSLCLLDGSRVIERPYGSDRLLGLHGSAAVVWRQRGDGPALVLIDAATGIERSFALRELPSGVGTANAWQLTADGAAAIAVAPGPDPARGESRLLRLALSDGAVTPVPLPRGAIRAGFLSAERGVAAGEDASTLWLTSDGGASWHARHAMSGVNRRIRCSDGRCVVDDLILVSFERPVPRATDRVLVSPEQRVPPRPHQSLGLDCRVNDTARRARDRGSLCGGELDAGGRVRLHNPGADVALTATAGGRWTVTWRGRDARGRYTGRAAAGELSLRGSIEWLELARATREGVVMTVTSEVVTSEAGEIRSLVWMPANGQAARVGDPDLPDAAVDDLLTLPTGELAVLLRFKVRDQPDHNYYRLLVVDREGRVRARRTYSWEWSRNGAIAFLDGTIGVQWAETDPARSRWFLAIDAAAPSRALAAVDVAAVSVCKALPGAAGAAAITIEGPEFQNWPADQGKAVARLYWRGDERPCLQAIELRQPHLGGRDVYVAASPRGDLRTVLDLPDVQKLRSLRCEVTTEQGPEPDRPGSGLGETWGAWAVDGTCPAPAGR